uniref:Uncharacterized protein n=1 Tax=viral metagenome TaxID=1070528 RepID=A0A6C0DXS1_9ZZZZ
MARNKTLVKQYYKNRQKTKVKKAQNRRSVKKRKIGGMFTSLRNLGRRRPTNAYGNNAGSDPFPSQRVPPIPTNRGRGFRIMNIIPGTQTVKYMTSGIRGSSSSPLHTSDIHIRPGISAVAVHQPRTSLDPISSTIKEKILVNSETIRLNNDEIKNIYQRFPTIFEKLAREDIPDESPYAIIELYQAIIIPFITQLPISDFNKSDTQNILELLDTINSNVIQYRKKLKSIVQTNDNFFSEQELVGYLNVMKYLENMRNASASDNFRTFAY